MKEYLRKLRASFRDEHDVAMELTLGWIAIMLTAVVILMVLGMLSG